MPFIPLFTYTSYFLGILSNYFSNYNYYYNYFSNYYYYFLLGVYFIGSSVSKYYYALIRVYSHTS